MTEEQMLMIQVSERLSSIEKSLGAIEHRLFGNGQPGDIDQLHGRLNGHGMRIAKLENWRWWLIGIGVGIGVGGGFGLSKVLEAMTR